MTQLVLIYDFQFGLFAAYSKWAFKHYFCLKVKGGGGGTVEIYMYDVLEF